MLKFGCKYRAFYKEHKKGIEKNFKALVVLEVFLEIVYLVVEIALDAVIKSVYKDS